MADEGRRGGIAHQKYGVHPAAEKGLGCVAGFQIGQLGRAAGFDAIELEEGQSQVARAAAGGADGQAFAGQLGQDGQGVRAPIKDKQRLIGNASEGNEFAVCAGIGHAALNESNVHREGRVLQALEVFQGALRAEDFQFDALAGKVGAVSFGIGLEGTAVNPAGENNGLWRRGFKEPKHGQNDDRADG